MKTGDIVKLISTEQYGIIHAMDLRNPYCLVNVYLFEEDIYKMVSIYDLEFIKDSAEYSDDFTDDFETSENEE